MASSRACPNDFQIYFFDLQLVFESLGISDYKINFKFVDIYLLKGKKKIHEQRYKFLSSLSKKYLKASSIDKFCIKPIFLVQ